MTMAEWAVLRKKWVAARDAAKPKVAAGAVRGVSLGDAIDRVNKAALKDYSALAVAVKKLLVDVKTYKTKMDKKNVALAKWIETNIEHPAAELSKAVDADVKALRALLKYFDGFDYKKEAQFPDNFAKFAIDADTKKKPIRQVHPAEYQKLVDSTDFYVTVAKAMHKVAGGLAVDIRKDQVRAALEDAADTVGHEVTVLQKLVDGADQPKFALELRPQAQATSGILGAMSDATVLAKSAIGK